jgi:hypothetical protein
MYILSVIVRVSFREQEVMGRSCLIPLSVNPRRYCELPSADSFGALTYSLERKGKKLAVHKQLINGFQHAYGSALVAFEMGELASDLGFRANEYMEAYCCEDGRSYPHYLDTRKDLFNNTIGRAIARDARLLRLSGKDADDYLTERVFEAVFRRVIIPHAYDSRVSELPTLDEYGCPGLPNPPGPLASTGAITR